MNVVTKIKLNKLQALIYELIINILFHIMVIILVWKFPTFDTFEKVLLILLLPIFIYYIFTLDKAILNNIKILFKTLDEPVFKKYGDPDEISYIIADMKKNNIYEDKKIIINNKFIMDKKFPYHFCAFKDIIAIGLEKTRTKYSGVEYWITIFDKYGNQIGFIYEKRKYNEDYINDIISKIVFRCPNAIVDTYGNIKLNKRKLKKEYHIESVHDYYSYDLDYYYNKMNEVLNNLEYSNFGEFKKDVYNTKDIFCDRIFTNDIEEFEFLIQQLGYIDFSDFYYTNMIDEEK